MLRSYVLYAHPSDSVISLSTCQGVVRADGLVCVIAVDNITRLSHLLEQDRT